MLQISLGAALTCSLVFLCSFIACSAVQSPNVEVQFVTPRVGWIVGPRLLQTTDSGQTWIEVRREGSGTLEAEDIFQGRNWVQFIDQEVGFSVGGSGIAKTSDGGRTWSSIVVTDGKDQSLQSLFFLSRQEGWVVGAHVYYTSDGGNRWIRLSKTPAGDELRQRRIGIAPTYAINNPAVWFTSSKDGCMARLDGEVHCTNDGGSTWEIVWRVDNSITDLFFINNQDGWVVGHGGFMARTTDRGKTWSTIPIPVKADLTSVFFINEQIGCAVGYEGTILCTKDGGVTWKQASINGRSNWPLASVTFSDEMHGWAVGGASDPMSPSLSAPSNLILATEDGGQTWRRIRL
jgi:photosystem II stability/assembly factor-like uncharacterized protein